MPRSEHLRKMKKPPTTEPPRASLHRHATSASRLPTLQPSTFQKRLSPANFESDLESDFESNKNGSGSANEKSNEKANGKSNGADASLNTDSSSQVMTESAPSDLAVARSDRVTREGNTHAKKMGPGQDRLEAGSDRFTGSESRSLLQPVRVPDIVATESSNSLEEVKRGMPGWLVSLIGHTALIIVLALLTLPDEVGINRISLLVSDTPGPELESVEFELQPLSPLFDNLETESQSEASAIKDDSKVVDDLFGIDPNVVAEEGFGAGLGQSDVGNLGTPQAPAPASKPTGKTDEGVQYFGTKAYGKNFIFVVDCSGSMSYPATSYKSAFVTNPPTRWQKAKEETKRAISQLTKEQTFLIYAYNSETFGMGGTDARTALLVEANEENKKRAYDWLDKGMPNNGTYPRRAVELALGLKPDAIFLLSDGEFGDRTARFTLKANRPRIWADGGSRVTPIHTIAFGKDGARTLAWIAERNDGVFTRVDF